MVCKWSVNLGMCRTWVYLQMYPCISFAQMCIANLHWSLVSCSTQGLVANSCLLLVMVLGAIPDAADTKCICFLIAGYFTFWVVLSLIWGLIATVVATLLPIWESRDALTNMFKHLAGKGGPLPSKLHPPLDVQNDEKPVQIPQQAVGDDTAHREQEIGNTYKP